MGNTLVDYKTDAGLAIITLNDPPMNAFTHEMMKDLDEAILDARFDNDVHVIVLTGHGERFFCAGANIQMLSEVDETFKYYFCLHTNETLNRLEQTPKLVIAALNGHAVGGGLEIALACDIRIARQGDGKVGLPEANLGLMPGSGGTQRAARLMGKSRALQLMVESENLDYERAEELGLVNYVWPADSREDFQAKVVGYARRFLPPDKASLAVGRIKRAVQSGLEMGFEQALALERELQAELWASKDAKEGLRAYIDKRKPKFSAR
ncbi:MAG TPA: enoyl-CoA hydratase/isomerase family protein [Polyangiaceae bacterium]|nr:enoyl-CoA hydratase/isomerase family protein [Polyangiaceae bacterium]